MFELVKPIGSRRNDYNMLSSKNKVYTTIGFNIRLEKTVQSYERSQKN